MVLIQDGSSEYKRFAHMELTRDLDLFKAFVYIEGVVKSDSFAL